MIVMRCASALCEWCGAEIVHDEARPGRPRRYCGRSCRQRAYEHRRGRPPVRVRERRVVALPAAVVRLVGTVHAVDPRCAVDLRGRVVTLCGQRAHLVPRPFSEWDRRVCQTCAELADRAVDPPSAPWGMPPIA